MESLHFMKNEALPVGGEIRPCVHLILENWVAGLILLPLSLHVEMLQ